ncbi:MAG: acyl-CoA dehydrogenase family protein [Ignavibacteriales bacterium]|jgi:acyl-CoA dehydrogenase
MAISFEIDKELEAIKEEVHRFAEKEVRPRLRDFERDGDVPEELRGKFSELDLNLIDYPEEYGGSGIGLTSATVIFEELAWGDVGAALSLINGAGLAGYALLEIGDESQKEKYLSPFLNPSNCRLRYALCLIEDRPDFIPGNMQTIATLVDGGFLISGKKFCVINGDRADLYVVFARVESKNEARAFIVDKNTAGLKFEKAHEKLGLICVPTADIILDGCKVPNENILDSTSDFQKALESIFIREKIISAALAVGCARAASEYAFKYASERVAFGAPLYQHQGLSFMMAEMAMEVDAARWTLWQAAWAFDKGKEEASVLAEKAVLQANKMGTRVTSDAVQILGGHGFIQDHPVEKWMRDVKTLSVLMGIRF